MMQRVLLLLVAACFSAICAAQPVIYKDASTLITGTWHGAGAGGTSSLLEVSTNAPHEGTLHYKFDYNYNAWWAGIGLNMDNWGSGAARNLSGFTHLRLAYRGLSGGQQLSIQLRNGTNFGPQVQVGGAETNYTVIDIPMANLVNGTLSANAVREIDLSIGAVQVSSGTVYLDAIELVNVTGGAGSSATAITAARAASLGRGVNTANWLEAYWLLPWNAYPEFTKYNRTNVSALKNAGFNSFRLPVTVERISPTTAPYTINFNQPAFQLVDSMILWANLFDFKLIIDNHHGYELTNGNYATELPRLQAIWAQLAQRYGSLDPNRFFFEIYNEFTPTINNTNARNLTTSVLATIRANEAVTHSVIVGATGWNSGPELLNFTPLVDSNVIYTFHNYDPYQFTHQGMSWTSPPNFPAVTFPQPGEVAAINDLFADVKAWSVSNSVPVFLGEYGCSTAADATSRCNWVQTLTSAIAAQGFSYFYWDAVQPTDAFGFYTGGVVAQANVAPCFATAIGLYSTPLAVEMQAFEADCQDDQPVLVWEASVSDDGHVFEIQASNDGITWQKAGSVASATDTRSYRWRDAQQARYYRLHITEPSGHSTYSAMVASTCAPAQPVAIYPNPATDWLHIQAQSVAEVALFDLNGRIVSRTTDAAQTQQGAYRVSVQGLVPGTYYLRIASENGLVEMKPIVVL